MQLGAYKQVGNHSEGVNDSEYKEKRKGILEAFCMR